MADGRWRPRSASSEATDPKRFCSDDGRSAARAGRLHASAPRDRRSREGFGQNAPTALTGLGSRGSDAGLEIRTRQMSCDAARARRARPPPPRTVRSRRTRRGAGGRHGRRRRRRRSASDRRTGHHDVARQLYQTLANWSPNRAEPWAGLPTARGRSDDEEEGRGRQGRAVRARARQSPPGEARYRAVNLRAGTNAGGGAQADETWSRRPSSRAGSAFQDARCRRSRASWCAR